MKKRRATGPVYPRPESGWGWPVGVMRGHFFHRSTRSLCARWDFDVGFIGVDVRPDELTRRCCATCVRLARRQQLIQGDPPPGLDAADRPA